MNTFNFSLVPQLRWCLLKRTTEENDSLHWGQVDPFIEFFTVVAFMDAALVFLGPVKVLRGVFAGLWSLLACFDGLPGPLLGAIPRFGGILDY